MRNLLPHLAGDTRIEVHVFLHVNQYNQFDPIDDRVRVHLFDFAEASAIVGICRGENPGTMVADIDDELEAIAIDR